MAYTTKHETELDSAEKMKAFIVSWIKSPVLRYCMAQRQTIQVIAHSFVHCLVRTHWKPRFRGYWMRMAIWI